MVPFTRPRPISSSGGRNHGCDQVSQAGAQEGEGSVREGLEGPSREARRSLGGPVTRTEGPRADRGRLPLRASVRGRTGKGFPTRRMETEARPRGQEGGRSNQRDRGARFRGSGVAREGQGGPREPR